MPTSRLVHEQITAVLFVIVKNWGKKKQKQKPDFHQQVNLLIVVYPQNECIVTQYSVNNLKIVMLNERSQM